MSSFQFCTCCMPLHSSVICKLAEDGFKDSVIYVIDEDDEQDGPQDRALGDTTDDTSEEGFVTIYTPRGGST